MEEKGLRWGPISPYWRDHGPFFAPGASPNFGRVVPGTRSAREAPQKGFRGEEKGFAGGNGFRRRKKVSGEGKGFG